MSVIKSIKKLSYIKLSIFLLAGICFNLLLPLLSNAAEMENYCLIPPYVKRNAVPNIMFLMDNSTSMLNPAYTDNYTPNATMDNYVGYYKSQACYQYGSSKFTEQLKVVRTTIGSDQYGDSYTYSDTCPSTAPFRGNLLNWATMSKFDILQKVIIGGNTVSKQGNANQLLSISGNWTVAGVKDNNTYSGCKFLVNNANLTISDVTAGSCTLLNATPSPIASLKNQTIIKLAQLKNIANKFSSRFSKKVEDLYAQASKLFEDIEIIPKAWAAQPTSIAIDTGTLDAAANQAYSLTLKCDGTCPNGTYSWSFTGLPSWITSITYSSQGQKTNYKVTISGTAPCGGNYTFTVNMSGPATASATYTIHVTSPALSISTTSLTSGTVGTAYSFTVQGAGGCTPYTWSATGLPPELTIDSSTGTISGVPTTANTYSVVITVTDANGITASKTLPLIIVAASSIRSQQFDVRVIMVEEPINDLNGNDIYDPGSGETFTNANGNLDEYGNPKWDGKQGVFQKYWDTINPKARWGLTKYTNQGVTIPSSGCIPASPASSYYTTIQNAQPEATFPLADGLYGIINYFGFNSTNFSNYDSNSYTGCNNSDPIDNTPCRKNFVLIITSGSDVTGSNFSQSDCSVTNNMAPIVQDACFGFKNDLRSDKSGKQNTLVYIVQTMGTTNKEILNDAAHAGGGQWYDAEDPSELEKQLDQAFKDILARAASGTAASVLASGQGQGANLIQAVFYPRTQSLQTGGIFNSNVDIAWIGKLSNYWYYIDPWSRSSSMREDTVKESPNRKLNLIDDYMMTFYYDPASEQTKASRCQDTNGDGVCDSPKPTLTLENVSNIWDAGIELWKRDISVTPRTIYTSIDGTNLINIPGDFSSSASQLQTYLLAADVNGAEAILRYIHGEDDPSVGGTTYNYRSRTVEVDLNGNGSTPDAGESAKVWKLGDVLNSTPKVSSWIKLNTYDEIYSDSSYLNFLNSSNYTNRGMVFAGANDGMLHAFKLGRLEIKETPHTGDACSLVGKDFACLSGTDLGKEMWAFIPKNSLPYLQYLTRDDYCHVYTVDFTPYIFDASIGPGTGDISDVARPGDGSTWRTVLIGGMRFGGACKNTCPDSDCVQTPANNLGYSSYFALDITDQNSPTLLWEFSSEDLGYSTTGPAIVRVGDKAKNGKWFVVFGSGPTGPISTTDQQFLGRSDQPLRLFILNLKTGTLSRTITTNTTDTDMTYAFAGSLYNATHDADLNYQDEVIYVPYVKRIGAGTGPNPYRWEDGGVGRLLTKENTDPGQWQWSKVIDNIGPVTSAAVRLQNTHTGKLWLYFGTGRYYFQQTASVDDQNSQRRLFGITEPCFQNNAFTDGCTTSRVIGDLSQVDLTTTTGVNDNEGWYINLDCSPSVPGCSLTGDFGAERVITDPLSSTSGVVFFTTLKPYTDICSLGGKSYIWAVKYDTGGAPGGLIRGTALLQVSTGSIEQRELSTAFTEAGGRKTAAMEGVPPIQQGLSILTAPPPLKRTIHIKER